MRLAKSISHTLAARQNRALSHSFTSLESLAYASFPSSPTSNQYPSEANVVIVGGGVIGASVAYHLSKLHVKNVVLLERHQLTSGTTWHAAGLVNTFGSLSRTSTEFRKYTRQLYSEILPQETGMSTGWMEVGLVELACNEERLDYYRRVAAFNQFCGVNVQEITPTQVKDLCPMIDTSLVLAGFHVPTDGRANPTDVTMALIAAAKRNGVTVLEHAPVAKVLSTKSNHGFGPPSVSGVLLENGNVIHCHKVVNCAGMWARQFAQASNVHAIPNQAAEHYYLLTEPIETVDSSWPVVEDASRCMYLRPEGGGLLLGLFETDARSWKHDETGVPNDASFLELEPDWDRMMPFIEKAMEIIPDVKNAGVKKLFCGPESFTPDGNPIIGESPELRNYYVAAGMNSLGILSAGGVGKLLAEWIKHGHAPNHIDVTSVHVNRFHPFQSNPLDRKHRAPETLANTYRIHYPNHQPSTCRDAKQSPLHDRLATRGAYFGNVSGWESPLWYASSGERPVVEKESFGRENWFPQWEAEHLACRNNVALFDMSFMSKFFVQGRDAGAFLNRLSTANVDGDAGRITYTQWLDERGYMQADLTVTKVNDEEFLVVATDTMHNQVMNHMLQRMTTQDHVFIKDMTARYALINLQGPRSRELLQTLTSEVLKDANFPFRCARTIDIGLARVLCCRITYVGELGYELFVPVEQARHVYDIIFEAGRAFDLKHAGLKALGSLRMEKGYRDYGHDMDNTDTLLDVGLSLTCDFDKNIPFIGQEHVLAQRQASSTTTWRFAQTHRQCLGQGCGPSFASWRSLVAKRRSIG
ncbi:hypothetical protein MPSEU_000580000 [Mayamaea pseudoterrestris]|nr:hypothetical protein MPSEU_000580000 [Mayamaea pseudoterrestris]